MIIRPFRSLIRAFASPAVAAAVFGAASCEPASAQTKLSPGDTQFAQDASPADATEIAASRLALASSSSQQVKKVAQQMIADHTKLARSLDVIATQKGLGKPPGADAALIGKLQGLKGDDFDKVYIDEVAVGGHQKAVQLFGKESESGNDAQLKAAAARALPTIRHHLAMAPQLANARKASS
ncbi:MAG TPA: DUF4142 domain-containing protein [Paraburkholderia sp.]|jgi:putative membrane protein|nr:DUF4142 domain-containing protein [Paraburkholderia sp.]